jgi:hypothetical protein
MKTLLLAFLALVALTGCQSTMSEDDRWLWNADTNAPPARPNETLD